MLDEFENLKSIHITCNRFTNKIITTLLKHSKSLKSLCLESISEVYNSETLDENSSLSSEQLLKIRNLVNLEKLNLKGSLPLNDDVFANIVPSCSKINHFAMGTFLFIFYLLRYFSDEFVFIGNVKNFAQISKNILSNVY